MEYVEGDEQQVPKSTYELLHSQLEQKLLPSWTVQLTELDNPVVHLLVLKGSMLMMQAGAYSIKLYGSVNYGFIVMAKFLP